MYFRLEKIDAAPPGSSGIVFETVLENREPRTATIFSYDFELWLLRDMNAAVAKYLARLSPDFHADFPGEFKPNVQKPLKLIWHYTPKQLQEVEEWRQDRNLTIEIRGHLLVASVWPGPSGTTQALSFQWEKPYQAAISGGGAYPIRISVPQSEWATLLSKIGFRHITLYELPMPSFPPGFARSESYLKEAWEHHWAGRRDEALLACFKAFECLGFNLYGEAKLDRQTFLERLMPGIEGHKRKVVEELWESLHEFFHLGRHERGQPIDLTHADTEMALIFATALLGYLAKQK